MKHPYHLVAQINGDRALLGFPDGICWVYLADLTLT